MIRTIAASAALVVVAGTMAYAQPKLEIVGGDTYDWGKVAPSKLTTVVQVKNSGSTDLKISEVRPGCGCTAAPIDKNLLKPGEVGKISITLDVTSRSGPVDKIVTITSNDSTSPMQVLHLKADVHRAITCTPMQYMLVTDAKMGVESPASPMTIKNTGDAPVTLQVPEMVDGGNIKVRFDMKGSKELKPGEEYILKAFVTPKEAQSLYGSVKMKTSSTEMPMIDISISGTMSQPSAVPPSSQK
ncbi:MAG TPA: DUF1573 domain-containing protein [Candidatus Kapabacteria bacterium]|nr:DUF1573 domain-containing protein [Candidatus Kapabacteria bacterium]